MKDRLKIYMPIFLLLLVFIYVANSSLGIQPAIKPAATFSYIDLPPGFRIDVFAENLDGSSLSTPGPNPGPRMMLLHEGILYVTVPSSGRVLALPDQDRDGRADETATFIEGLDKPHGIDYDNGWFYIAEEGRVIRVRGGYGLAADSSTIQVLIDDIPKGGHYTRTVKVHGGYLYVSIGSSCNVCHEDDPRRAAITRCNLDGTNCTAFAKGLRNAVGITFSPETGELYATDNGRDLLGDDTPPDEVNVVREGKDYGWPICYGKRIHDTDFDKNVYVRDPCEDSEPSLVDLQAHSAPLGLVFYYGDMFPEEYRGDLFVAYHGSWNRREPTGYKVVVIDASTLEVRGFATGWLQPSGVLGRPVDVLVADDGALLVTDDNAGKIYRITYGS